MTAWGEIVKDKLARKCKFPSEVQVVLARGERTQHAIVLGLRTEAANQRGRP